MRDGVTAGNPVDAAAQLAENSGIGQNPIKNLNALTDGFLGALEAAANALENDNSGAAKQALEKLKESSELLEGFMHLGEPNLGAIFPVLATSRTGTFTTVTGTAIAAGKQFTAGYNAADVTLTVTP